MDVPDKVFQILFHLDFEQTSEITTATVVDENDNVGTDVCSETYAVSDQQSVIEIVSKLLADSFLEIPCRNNTEKMMMPTCAHDGEGVHNFTVGTEENARDQ